MDYFNLYTFFVLIILGLNIDAKLLLKSLFPTTFANNWYITCYLIFYLIHPYLNLIINQMYKRELFIAGLVMAGLYYGAGFFYHSAFFRNNLSDFIVIYFVIAYIKKYHAKDCHKRNLNIILLLVTFFCNLVLIVVTNELGLRLDLFQDKLIYWKISNPFILLMVISAFNLFNNVKVSNSVINYISKMSLYIYLIHENILLRELCRPYLWI